MLKLSIWKGFAALEVLSQEDDCETTYRSHLSAESDGSLQPLPLAIGLLRQPWLQLG